MSLFFHDLCDVISFVDKVLEAAVGRAKSDSTELSRKMIQSHVARMTGGKEIFVTELRIPNQ